VVRAELAGQAEFRNRFAREVAPAQSVVGDRAQPVGAQQVPVPGPQAARNW
jgi:hypothetical protein